MPAIVAQDLKRSFYSIEKQPGIGGSMKALFAKARKETQAVKGVSFEIEPGELVGFLGPNGAGKTTTIKMLTGILHPTTGEAKVLGFDPFMRQPELLRQISLVMGNKCQLWWDLPAWDSFVVFRELYGIDHDVFKARIEMLLDIMGLTEKVHTQVRKMSLGERMKCELVAALLHGPKVIFLDEPTIGLDLVSQKRIREFLAQVNQDDGCTIVLTSHYMLDVEELCKRVVVIDQGTLIYDGELKALSDRYSNHRHLRLQFSSAVAEADLTRFGTIVESDATSATLSILKDETPAITAKVLSEFPVADLGIEDVSIEEVIRNLFSESTAK
jgi:ABC-2 type transport system ATP-binding protein